MWSSIIPSVALVVTSFIGYLSYKIYVKKPIINAIINKLTEPSSSGFEIDQSGSFGVVSYHRYGQQYRIVHPFSKKMIRPMRNLRAYLEIEGREVEITQQPGLWYLYSAGELGGERIILVSGNDKKFFSKGEVPNIKVDD